MRTIPVTYTETFSWLNAGSLFHIANGNKRDWHEVEISQEVLNCKHEYTESERAFPDDIYTDMSRITCVDCGEVFYEN